MAATADDITGLPTRMAFRERMNRADPGSAVLIADIDRFRQVNEQLGSMIGDDLLVAIAQRIGLNLPTGTMIARIGDDEFGVLVEPPASVDAAGIAEQLRLAVVAPMELGGIPFTPSVTIGVATGECGADQSGLWDRAVAALCRARRRGSHVGVAGPSSAPAGASDLALECSLRTAHDRGELSLVYQPIATLPYAVLAGFETLMRWTSPTWGPVSPARFIPVAEETGIIVPLGIWALESAAQQQAQWASTCNGTAPYVAVNVSGRQLRTADFLTAARQVVSRTGVDPSHLVLELTESLLVEDPDGLRKTLLALREDGFRVAIDDFGTGYSALAHLHRFPVDILKIDRSFVVAMRSSPIAATVVRATVQLAHALGLDVVAEGVETADEMGRMAAQGCDFAQGYWLARPLPIAEATAVLLCRDPEAEASPRREAEEQVSREDRRFGAHEKGPLKKFAKKTLRNRGKASEKIHVGRTQ